MLGFMMRRPNIAACRLAAALAASIFGVTEAEADPQTAQDATVAAPVLSPGDRFRFREGDRTYLVSDIGWQDDLFVSIVEFEDGRRYRDYYTPDLNLVASEQIGSPERTTFAPDSMKYRFPMRIGLAWSGTYETVVKTASGFVTEQFSTSQDCEARCIERIDVPAGSFESFRIECTRKQTNQRFEELATYWYSPEAGVSVLSESIRRDMPGLVARQELIELERAHWAEFDALPNGVESTCDFSVAVR